MPEKLRSKKVIIITTLVVIAIITLLLIYGRPLWELFANQERAEEFIENAGPFGPIVFILMQIVQVFIAPIPGQVTGFLGGYLFGTFWGTVYAMIGATIGFTLIFVLARRLGRPFVKRFVDEKTLKKFDYIAESKGVFVLFLIFLLPLFPDDLICYIAGLTTIKIRTLVIISLLGRFPSTLLLSFTGSGVADSNITVVVVVLVVTLVISAFAYWKRDKLEQVVKQIGKKAKSKKNKK